MNIGEVFVTENDHSVNIEWKIKDFSSLSQEGEENYYSPGFTFDNLIWYFVISPNGVFDWSSGHVDLSLCSESHISTTKQEFSISFKTRNGEKDFQTRCTRVFGTDSFTHTFVRFILRSELEVKESELLTDDTLTVVCEMKKSAESISGAGTSGSTNLYENKLNHDFKELFLKQDDCDVTIKVKNSEFRAHKIILKARSPVLAANFRHNMKENKTGIIEVEDCDPTYFSDFLCFLYCGDHKMISKENVFSLFTIADKYGVLDLRAKCLEFMKKNLCIDTFCETMSGALRHSETELIDLAKDFFLKNTEDILLTVKWQTFVAENPTQSNELFLTFVRSVKVSSA